MAYKVWIEKLSDNELIVTLWKPGAPYDRTKKGSAAEAALYANQLVSWFGAKFLGLQHA